MVVMSSNINHRVSCGRDLFCVPDIYRELSEASSSGFDFIAVPIVHPRYRREFLESNATKRPGAFTRADLLLTSQDWSSYIVGKISPWLELDSPVYNIRKNSEKALEQELNYASHLSLPAILLPSLTKNSINLARCIYDRLMNGPHLQVWVQVPIKTPESLREDLIQNEQIVENSDNETWMWWNTFRSVCDNHKLLGIALELSADLPSDDVLTRWLGEPIKCALISTSLFLTNKKGYPVLSRAHQLFVRKLFRMDVQIMITCNSRHSDKGVNSYQQYMEHLWQSQPPPDSVDNFAKGYEDFLQCPLQPLMDNLESQTYEIFEKDPVKYSEYQKAIYQALLDRVSEEDKDTKIIVIMVVGAGRGPLVRASLRAAKDAGRMIRVYAVEKNPNAIVTLQSMQDEMWGDQVTVVASDMRDYEPSEKADILISELLGSFGDNELSPECLDGAQRLLKMDGISIPCKYTSYIAPIQSSKLYNSVRHSREIDKNYLAPFETPYVVRLQNRAELSAPKPVFTFTHPNWGPVDNSRYKALQFDVKESCILHGFAGYFDTILYKDCTLSIVPQTHSPGMFSWFPLFFPIKDPMFLPKSSKVEVHFWRNANKRNVWYEWCVTQPSPSPLHNPNGRSYTIGL